MTIEEIKDTLIGCANYRCYDCKFKTVPKMYCQQELIKKMGKECEKVVAEMGDDGK